MAIQVIATDIDLTLIDNKGHLPATNIEALQQAVAKGVRIVIATARRYQPTVSVINKLDIPATLICHNGARIWDEHGRELYHQTLDFDTAYELAKLADAEQLPLIFTIDEINYYNPQITQASLTTLLDHVAVTSLVDALSAPPTRIVVRSVDAITRISKLLQDSQHAHLFQYARGDNVYSAIIAHPRVCKENALASLCQAWRIPATDVLSIGDAEADAGMLRWAGVGVAVKDAMPQALAAADWVAPSARLGGVAVAIHRYVLK